MLKLPSPAPSAPQASPFAEVVPYGSRDKRNTRTRSCCRDAKALPGFRRKAPEGTFNCAAKAALPRQKRPDRPAQEPQRPTGQHPACHPLPPREGPRLVTAEPQTPNQNQICRPVGRSPAFTPAAATRLSPAPSRPCRDRTAPATTPSPRGEARPTRRILPPGHRHRRRCLRPAQTPTRNSNNCSLPRPEITPAATSASGSRPAPASSLSPRR